jgi:exopolysaccharide production protein ExoQ
MGFFTKLQNACLGMTAIALSGALLPLIFASNDFNYVDGSAGYQTVLAVLYLIVAIIAISHLRRTLSSLLISPALLGLILLACVSPLWADNPPLVMRRVIGLAGTSLFGIVLGTVLDIDEQSRLLRRVLGVTAVMSLACVLLTPEYGIANRAVYGGAWNGVFGQKNGLGAAMAVGLLIEWFQPIATPKAKLLKLLSLWLFGTLLLCSHSSTSVGSLFVTFLIVYQFRKLRAQHRIPFLFAVAAVLVIAIIVLTALAMEDFPVYPLGRSSTLTARTELWALLVEMTQHRLLFGYGYGGFWGGGSKEFYLVTSRLPWNPMYAHNGYFEVVVSLGLTGLLLALAFLKSGIRSAVRRASKEELPSDLLPFAFLILFLLHNIAECTILLKNSLEWALCISFVVSSRYAAGDLLGGSQAAQSDYLPAPIKEVA